MLVSDNLSFKMLFLDISLTQDKEVGDGTTSVTVLAAELLKEAEIMIATRIHPQTIISGYRKALTVAQEALQNVSLDSGYFFVANTLKNNFLSENLENDLLKIAKTSMGSKILSQHYKLFSKLAVNAVLRLKGGSLDSIQVIKKLGGSMEDSYLDEGFLLEKKPGMYQPQKITHAKILIANTPMDTDKVI